MLMRIALNRLSWNSRDNQVGMVGHESTDVYWLRLSLPLGELQTRFRSILLLHSIVLARMKMEISSSRLVIPRPRYIRHITFPLSYLSPSSLVPESIPAIRNCPQFISSTGDGKTHLVPRSEYHPRRKRSSLFAGNDTDRPDFVGLHPG